MFKNKALQVKFVKSDQPVTPPPVENVEGIIESSIKQLAESTKDVIHFAAKVGAGYVALDTARKVAIALASNK